MSNNHDATNRSVQLNPNNAAYWTARGFPGRPADWQNRISQENQRPDSGKSERK